MISFIILLSFKKSSFEVICFSWEELLHKHRFFPKSQVGDEFLGMKCTLHSNMGYTAICNKLAYLCFYLDQKSTYRGVGNSTYERNFKNIYFLRIFNFTIGIHIQKMHFICGLAIHHRKIVSHFTVYYPGEVSLRQKNLQRENLMFR